MTAASERVVGIPKAAIVSLTTNSRAKTACGRSLSVARRGGCRFDRPPRPGGWLDHRRVEARNAQIGAQRKPWRWGRQNLARVCRPAPRLLLDWQANRG